MMTSIKNLQTVQEEIKQISSFPEKVKLLAVSKKQSSDKIYALYTQGQRLFGENYLQEAIEKIEELKKKIPAGDPIEWHFIGHLQSNKINPVVGVFSLIHSVDSLKKVELISKSASKKNITQRILIEVNIGEENSKSGFMASELLSVWKNLISIPNVKIEGLMCLPPATENTQEQLANFNKMTELKEKLLALTAKDSHLQNNLLSELSMGTSGDYSSALQAGATIIRLGTILFGERG